MKETLEKAEQIVSERFDKNDKNYGLLVLSCYALLTKFEPYQELVKDIFSNCQFHIDKKTLLQLLYEEKYNIEEINPYVKFKNLVGLSESGNDLHFDTKFNCYIKTPPSIYCSTIGDKTEVLDTLIHELAHLVKDRINNNYIDSDGLLIKRGGIQIQCEEKDMYCNLSLDEAINTLQTADMTEYIKDLNKKIMSKETRKFFVKLNHSKLGKIYGNELIANLLLPLWKNEHFKSNIESNIVEGKIQSITDDFNNVIGNECAFSDFSEAFDIIDNSDDITPTMINRYEYVQTICKLYNIKSTISKTFTKA